MNFLEKLFSFSRPKCNEIGIQDIMSFKDALTKIQYYFDGP